MDLKSEEGSGDISSSIQGSPILAPPLDTETMQQNQIHEKNDLDM